MASFVSEAETWFVFVCPCLKWLGDRRTLGSWLIGFKDFCFFYRCLMVFLRIVFHDYLVLFIVLYQRLSRVEFFAVGILYTNFAPFTRIIYYWPRISPFLHSTQNFLFHLVLLHLTLFLFRKQRGMTTRNSRTFSAASYNSDCSSYYTLLSFTWSLLSFDRFCQVLEYLFKHLYSIEYHGTLCSPVQQSYMLPVQHSVRLSKKGFINTFYEIMDFKWYER